jgi:hypothetical protein
VAQACYRFAMSKTRKPAGKIRTHFEQVPLAAVKKVTSRDEPTPKPPPGNVIVERKTEPYSMRIDDASR